MKTKSLSQIALALVVGGSAVFFAACGADESKAPKAYNYGWSSIVLVSQDDDTIIEDVVVRGRDGECAISFEPELGEKVNYGERFWINGIGKNGKCERKNGALQIDIKTNFGTYTYENKDDKTTLK